MAKASYAPMFETVSGALNKINKNSPHAGDQTMVWATHRTAPTTSTDWSRVYLRGLSSVTRSTEPSADELAVRSKFSAVSAAVSARMQDPSKKAADLAAFNAQKNTKGGKTTMRSYIWSLEAAAYDAEQG